MDDHRAMERVSKPRNIVLVAYAGVQSLDVTGPLSVLSAAGRQWNFQPFKIDLVANGVGQVTTRSVERKDLEKMLIDEIRPRSPSGTVICWMVLRNTAEMTSAPPAIARKTRAVLREGARLTSGSHAALRFSQ